jgi:hypothetical protein
MTTLDAEAFYRERDRRTREYTGDEHRLIAALNRPLQLHVGSATAASAPGRLAVLGLLEQLARTHRHLQLNVPADLAVEVSQRAIAINPYIQIDVVNTSAAATAAVSIGVGTEVPAGLDWYASWRGGLAVIDTLPTETGLDAKDLVGAATAACLAAGVLFRYVTGQSVEPCRVNLVERQDGAAAGTTTVAGPINVGRVVVVGAGAVTHALTYWARALGGVTGKWQTVDKDTAELHNTNRCLGMTAADAGWRGGIPTGEARPKAETAAAAIDAEYEVAWFDEYWREERADLLLCLANERSVRQIIASQGEPLLLHAATSPNWTAELHRHISGRDDCPACRLPERSTPVRFECSTAPITPDQPASGDAALPFLSATAGLLLAIALCQLRDGDELITGGTNHWRVRFDTPTFQLQNSRWPGGSCPHTLTPGARQSLYANQPRRWDRFGKP